MDFIDHRSTANFKFSLSATDEKLRIKSDGNVGIGVSNPSTKLEVDGVITTAGLTTTANINFGDDDKAIFGAGSDLQIYHDSTTNDSIITESGAGNLVLQGNALRLTNTAGVRYLQGNSGAEVNLWHNGNKKLETTSTGIDVTGTVTADGLEVEAATPVIEIDSTTSANLATLQFATSGTVDSKITHQASTGVMTIDSGRNATWGGKIDFVTDTDTRMRISNNGDISFYEDTGTTAKLFWDASAESLGIGQGVFSGTQALNLKGEGIAIKNDKSGSNNNWSLIRNTGTASTSNISFVTGAGEALVLAHDTNVGIGTDSPNSYSNLKTLTINGTNGSVVDFETNGTLSGEIFSESNSLKIDAVGSSGVLKLLTNSAERMQIASNGNVGIGTSSPSKTLDIEGNIRAKNTAGSSGAEIDITSGGTWRFRSNPTTGTNSYGLDIVKGSAGTDVKMSINSSGNVGIGTSSPAATLDVVKTGAGIQDTLQLRNAQTLAAGVGSSLGFGDSGGARLAYIAGAATGANNDNGYLSFYTRASDSLAERMRIDSSGNVGIGTSSPSTALHLSGLTGSPPKLTLEEGGAESRIYATKNSPTNSDLRFQTEISGTIADRMVINYSGNVGIGTSSPTSVQGFAKVLKLEDSSNASIVVSGGLHEAEYAVSSSGGWFGTSTNIPQRFITNNTERMRIDSSGMLGLGSTPPTDAHATWSQFFIGEKGSVFSEKLGSGGIYGLWLTDNDYIDADTGNHAYRTTDEASAINLEAGNTIFYRAASGTAGAALTWSESMRIDSSGNLMVGKTDTSIATQGVFFGPNYSHITSTNDTPLALSRKSSDGTILDIRKDGTTVGSIFNSGTTMGIGSLDTGVLLANNIDAILPWNSSTNAERDNAIDLGRSAGRFKDLYLSGTANVGGVAVIGTDATDVASIGTSGQRVYIKPNGTEIIYNASGNSAGQHVWQTGNAERMRIDASGNLGLGVSSPTNKFNVDFSITGEGSQEGGIKIQNSHGANNDIAPLYFGVHGGTRRTKAAIGLKRTGSYGIGDLIFALDSNGDDANVTFANDEKMRIDSSGNLLVGKTSADNTTQGIRMLGSSGFMSVVRSNDNLVVLNRIDGDGSLMEFRTNGTTRGSISISGSTTSYNTSSDQRLKDNIVDAPSASDDIDAIQVRSFDWKADGSHQKYGMVAQELQSVAPKAVSKGATEEDMMGVDYSKLVPMMLKEIQSLRARVAQLEGAN